MSNLIDYTYSKTPFVIPNLDDEGSVGDALRETFERYITIYEKKYIVLLLGQDLYDLLQTNIDSTDAIWVELKDMLRDETTYKSAIYNYVYYFYASENSYAMSSMFPNSGLIHNLCNAWNEMVDLSLLVWEFLVENASDYNDFNEAFTLEYTNTYGI